MTNLEYAIFHLFARSFCGINDRWSSSAKYNRLNSNPKLRDISWYICRFVGGTCYAIHFFISGIFRKPIKRHQLYTAMHNLAFRMSHRMHIHTNVAVVFANSLNESISRQISGIFPSSFVRKREFFYVNFLFPKCSSLSNETIFAIGKQICLQNSNWIKILLSFSLPHSHTLHNIYIYCI